MSIHARRNIPRERFAIYHRTHPVLGAAVHDVDLSLWYSGDRVRRVRAYERRIQPGENPDVFWGILEFVSGAIAVIENVWLVPDARRVGLDAQVEVIGAAGMAHVVSPGNGLTVWDVCGQESPDILVIPEMHDGIAGALRDEIAYFVRCIERGERATVVTMAEAVESIRVALALIESGQRDGDVQLE